MVIEDNEEKRIGAISFSLSPLYFLSLTQRGKVNFYTCYASVLAKLFNKCKEREKGTGGTRFSTIDETCFLSNFFCSSRLCLGTLSTFFTRFIYSGRMDIPEG